jgi:mRNA-degrading endonuclease toxin of MazEF toxin-antitoxin module
VPLSGGLTTGVVLCNQIRALDIASRGGEYRETLSPEILDDVLARVAAMLGWDS